MCPHQCILCSQALLAPSHMQHITGSFYRHNLRLGHLQEIFSRILDRQLTWPEDVEVSPECKDLVDRLLQLDACERLGHRGAGEIKLHPWFKGLDWTSLARTKAAFIPAVESETDTSYFFDKPVGSLFCSVSSVLFCCGWASEALWLREPRNPGPGQASPSHCVSVAE